jgi:hypothetical protein
VLLIVELLIINIFKQITARSCWRVSDCFKGLKCSGIYLGFALLPFSVAGLLHSSRPFKE